MSLNVNQIKTITKLYPQITRIVGDVATDVNGNQVSYNLAAVQAQAQADEAAKQATHASALAKLKTLGLTDDEISALKGTL
jgi:hypothetical protein